MVFKHRLHLQLLHARTRIYKAYSAPDRWCRRRWAKKWGATGSSSTDYADSARDLITTGFSLCRPDEYIKKQLLSDWTALKLKKSNRPISDTERKVSRKHFFDELLTEEDLRSYPAFFAVATDERLLQIVMDAMGMVPHLESIDVLESKPTDKALSASQLWHYDINDARIIKLFVYLEDCGPRNGPFTFIPADSSRKISAEIGHYVDDDRICARVPREEWRAVEGRAGTFFLIDTGRCYHMGSRSELPRYAYVATYSSGLKFMKRSKMWGKILADKAVELSPLQKITCGLATCVCM